MIPKPNKHYQLKYVDPSAPAWTHYAGSGVYTGEIDELSAGTTLYRFKLETGEWGSFDESCCVHEVSQETSQNNIMENITIPKSEYNSLKHQSSMLGQIGLYVEDFCDEEDTALQGVQTLLSNYYYMKADMLLEDVARTKRK